MLETDIHTKAKILDYGVSANGKGNPQVFIEAAVEGATYPTVTWFGQLTSEGSREITLKALLICGFKKNSDFSQIAEGKEGGALDVGRVVDVLFGPETWEGKTREKIKYFNAPGSGSGSVQRFDASEAKKALSAFNLKAEMAAVRNENPNLDKISEGVSEEMF